MVAHGYIPTLVLVLIGVLTLEMCLGHTSLSLTEKNGRSQSIVIPTLRALGCVPKYFCEMQVKPPSKQSTLMNDLMYLMKFAVQDQVGIPDVDNDEERKLSYENVRVRSLKRKNPHLYWKYKEMDSKLEKMAEDYLLEHGMLDHPEYLKFINVDSKMKVKNAQEKAKKEEMRRIDKRRKPMTTPLQKFAPHRTGRSLRTSFLRRNLAKGQSFLGQMSFAARVGEQISKRNRRDQDGLNCTTAFDLCPYSLDQMRSMIRGDSSPTPGTTTPTSDKKNTVESLHELSSSTSVARATTVKPVTTTIAANNNRKPVTKVYADEFSDDQGSEESEEQDDENDYAEEGENHDEISESEEHSSAPQKLQREKHKATITDQKKTNPHGHVMIKVSNRNQHRVVTEKGPIADNNALLQDSLQQMKIPGLNATSTALKKWNMRFSKPHTTKINQDTVNETEASSVKLPNHAPDERIPFRSKIKHALLGGIEEIHNREESDTGGATFTNFPVLSSSEIPVDNKETTEKTDNYSFNYTFFKPPNPPSLSSPPGTHAPPIRETYHPLSVAEYWNGPPPQGNPLGNAQQESVESNSNNTKRKKSFNRNNEKENAAEEGSLKIQQSLQLKLAISLEKLARHQLLLAQQQLFGHKMHSYS